MILDHLDKSKSYEPLHRGYAEAFAFLRNTDLNALEPGRLELLPKLLYAHVERAQGRGRAASPLEAHRRFIDIQYTVSGAEEIGWRDLASCTQPREPFDVSRDIGFFFDPPLAWVAVPPGCFAIYTPNDAHAPLAGAGPLFKIVMKVAVA